MDELFFVSWPFFPVYGMIAFEIYWKLAISWFMSSCRLGQLAQHFKSSKKIIGNSSNSYFQDMVRFFMQILPGAHCISLMPLFLCSLSIRAITLEFLLSTCNCNNLLNISARIPIKSSMLLEYWTSLFICILMRCWFLLQIWNCSRDEGKFLLLLTSFNDEICIFLLLTSSNDEIRSL